MLWRCWGGKGQRIIGSGRGHLRVLHGWWWRRRLESLADIIIDWTRFECVPCTLRISLTEPGHANRDSRHRDSHTWTYTQTSKSMQTHASVQMHTAMASLNPSVTVKPGGGLGASQPGGTMTGPAPSTTLPPCVCQRALASSSPSCMTRNCTFRHSIARRSIQSHWRRGGA